MELLTETRAMYFMSEPIDENSLVYSLCSAGDSIRFSDLISLAYWDLPNKIKQKHKRGSNVSSAFSQILSWKVWYVTPGNIFW